MSGRRRTTRGGSLGPWVLLMVVLSASLTAVTLAPATSGAAGSGPAEPAAASRAVVVIDSGTQRTASCVRFDEPSISGLEALKRSGASVVDQSFGTMGGAVCSINGIGCPLTGCLTCKAPAYWNYFRAVGGNGFSRSGTGSSTAKVRDGDIEGWAWGTHPSAPPLPTVDAVCGTRPTPPAPGPPPAAAPPVAAPGPVGPAAAAPGEGDPVAVDADPGEGDGSTATTPAEAADAVTTTTDTPTDPSDDLQDLEIVEGEALAAARDADSSDPPWLSLGGFALLVAGLAAWGVAVRRRRLRSL